MQKISNSLASTGQFCTVTWVTLDGTIRTINGRVGVKKYLKGYKRSAAAERDYLLIWKRDGSKKFDAPRNIKRDSIIEIKAHGVKLNKNHFSTYASFV